METYGRQAALLKAIGHPVRLQIVDLLRIEPECVCHLSAALGKPQPYVSQQLAILRNAGVIVDERDGTNISHRLADDNVARQVAAACVEHRSENAGGHAMVNSREMLACCNCPKCSIARGQGTEAYKVALFMTLRIKILGGGCENCDRLAQNAKLAVAQLSVDATFEKSGDYAEYAHYSLLATPGLVVNDQLVSGGRVPTPEQIVTMLTNVLSADTN